MGTDNKGLQATDVKKSPAGARKNQGKGKSDTVNGDGHERSTGSLSSLPIGRRGFMLAGVVLLVAVCIQVAVSQGVNFAGYVDAVGWHFFGFLESDVVGFALPAAYFRWVVPVLGEESRNLKTIWSLLVGVVAYINLGLRVDARIDDYRLLFSVLAATYAFPCFESRFGGDSVGSRRLVWKLAALAAGASSAAVVAVIMAYGWVAHAASAVVGICTVMFACRILAKFTQARLATWVVCAASFVVGVLLVAPFSVEVIKFLMPIDELAEAYDLVRGFVGASRLWRLSEKLLIVTVFCQLALGYLGIAFIRQGQTRKNSLIEVGEGRRTAHGYARLVGMYMLTAALPYMCQRTVMENVNGYIHGRFARDVEAALRLDIFFPKREDGTTDTMLTAIQGSKHTVEAYTDAFNAIVGVGYSTVEGKLFALPKLMLLPGMLSSQPWLVATVLPASVGLDVCRARAITFLTKRVEALSREIRELANRRSKMEQHDAKNEELIRRGDSSQFAEDQWRTLADTIESRTLRYQAIISLRAFINFLYTQDFLTPSIEMVIGFLLETGHILNADIWVYQRVVEDAMGLLLTRFRMDASLASMRTNMDRVADLSERLENARARGRATCSVSPGAGAITIRNLEFSRGPSHVLLLPDLTLQSGRIYAVTGANGCGKSSFFGVLASCGRKATLLPDKLEIRRLDELVMPSDDVVEITQQFYCPLFTKPIEWLLQRQGANATMPQEELRQREEQILGLLRELEFYGSDQGEFNAEQLHADQDDWYAALSGGQRGKVEFIRKVFLHSSCPDVLLIDESFAPLDPKSKLAIQRKLKQFCAQSLILVIYHTDEETCVAGGSFFDANLHFGNGTASVLETCQA